ncbi:spore coat assembly protein [Gracilibacillus halotolerans]|uniref:Spore coat assembly protein n=1 Tax=Gracilibacillus halotolerans TaxID=74386 RepID=A0A841RLC6_9BACI|nr:sporulation peptidase YabG [Gracilibacillus halotolerans]MBB6512677.1 spore coat assembly protein [Gracilibacillus halotolerans]
MKLSTGMLVTRYSYEHDIVFRIKGIINNQVVLHGEDLRLEADAPPDDLRVLGDDDLRKREEEMKEKEEYSYRLFRQDYQLMKNKKNMEDKKDLPRNVQRFQIPVKVLHIDGDRLYLKKCIELYKKLGLQVHGVYMEEHEVPLHMSELLEKIKPDVLVITGHDSYSESKGEKRDIKAYRNSRFFAEAVRIARTHTSHLDQLVIFAGACQSHFESLIRAGANFASSPERINIHALDPVYVVAKIAYTSFMDKINVYDVISNTFTGEKGLGGMETRGLYRTGIPYMENK